MTIRVFADRRELELELARELAARPVLTDSRWRPVRLLVPTPIDRVHLASRLVGGGSALLGVRIQSLRGHCHELLAGDRPVRILPRVLMRRLVRARPSLAGVVDRFEAGDGVVADAVERLLAAGLDPAVYAAAHEALAPVASASAERTVDLLELSLAVAEVLEQAEVMPVWQVPAQAARRLARRPPVEQLWGVGLPLTADFDEVVATVVASGGSWWCEASGTRGRGSSSVPRQSRLARLGVPAPEPREIPLPTLWSTSTFDGALCALVEHLPGRLEAGCPPERCVVVYADVEQGRLALEGLRDAGLPAVAPLVPAAPNGEMRRRLALSRVIEAGPGASMSDWFGASENVDHAGLAAWRFGGWRTVGEAAEAQQSSSSQDRRGDDSPAAVAEVVAAWSAFHAARSLGPGLAALERLVRPFGTRAVDLGREVATRLEAEIPAQLAMEAGELAAIVIAELRDSVPAGVDGGGIRVLPVDAAAQASWGLTVVLDLSATALEPRRHADPLFPDSILRRLEPVLPGLAEDRELDPEEQLLRLTAASAQAIWVCSRRTFDGASAIASSLWHWAIERGGAVVELQPTPRRLAGGLAALADDLDNAELARHRIATAEEIDHRVGAFGPHLGQVSPRRARWWATRLEAIVRCPWRHFLEQQVGLEPILDPPNLGSLASRLVGTVVHRAIERLGRDAMVRPSGTLQLPADLEAWLAPLAHAVPDARGAPLVAAAAAVRAASFVRAACRVPEVARGRVIAVESDGEASVDGATVRFRADLVLDLGYGPVWVDFKVGAVPDPAIAARFDREIAAGRRLQAALYGKGPGVAASAYVFLGNPERQDLDPRRWLGVAGDDPAVDRALASAVGLANAAVELGVAIPRLVGPDLEREGPWCRQCTVAEVCSRGDSGIRRRLVDWVEGRAGSSDADHVAASLVRLGAPP